jgi:hypothetical protein
LIMTCGQFATISYIKDWKTLTPSHSHQPPPLELKSRSLSRRVPVLRCCPSSARATRDLEQGGHRLSYVGSAATPVPPTLGRRCSPHAVPPPLPVSAMALGYRHSLFGQASRSVHLTTTPCVTEATMARSSSKIEVNSLANGSPDGYQLPTRVAGVGDFWTRDGWWGG